MKKGLIILFILFSLTAIAQGKAEKKILNNIKALNSAIFMNRDSAVLLHIVGERVTYGHSSGKIENKAEMVHNAMVSPTTYKDFGMSDVSIVVDGKTAIVRHVLKARSFDATGKEGVLHLNVLQTWIKKNKQWILAARQAVKLS
jgi:ketosteroid isomerase-like protein